MEYHEETDKRNADGIDIYMISAYLFLEMIYGFKKNHCIPYYLQCKSRQYFLCSTVHVAFIR